MSSLAAAVVLVLAPLPAAAFCESHPDVAAEFAEADFVYAAYVEGGRQIYDPAEDDQAIVATEYVVRPIAVFKGRPPRDLTLYSENDSARYYMEFRGQYLIFVSRGWGGRWIVNSCGNSFDLADTDAANDATWFRRPFDQFMMLSAQARHGEEVRIAAFEAERHAPGPLPVLAPPPLPPVEPAVPPEASLPPAAVSAPSPSSRGLPWLLSALVLAAMAAFVFWKSRKGDDRS